MADYLHDGFYEQALQLMAVKDFKGMAIPGHRLLDRSLTSPEMMRMFHEMERRNVFLSITLADGDRQVAELQEVISECPRLRIAIGHLGMANPPETPCWENQDWQMQIKLARNPNVMIETGGVTWLYNSEFYPFPSAIRAIREAADLVGMDRLMWGSDYPRTITAITYRMSYDFIVKSQELSEEDKRLLLGENARRFYGFQDMLDLPYIKNMSE
jgi:predicted TIM-barrel fold metal-dependent hydrolase